VIAKQKHKPLAVSQSSAFSQVPPRQAGTLIAPTASVPSLKLAAMRGAAYAILTPVLTIRRRVTGLCS
jgi:hypothetical protein